MFTDAGLQDKVAIVTGGARGIGKATVEALAKNGAEVFFFYNQSEAQANAFVDECKSAGLKVNALKVDVTDKAKCEETVNKIFDQTQKIDILVNNSGIIRDHLMMALSEEDIRAVIDTNIIGVFNVTQCVAPYMVSRRSGKIINISSVSGEKGGRGQANYAASKGAINAFTKALAVELAPRKINVNAVAPGVIETDISKDIRELATDEVLSKILLKRFGQPQEVANAVLFLASKYADYITGEILHVDGGFKMA
jgi:3-oxoacyl-[acyl-carrier protein] reductase